MKLKEIIEFIDEKIPESMALKSDEVGFKADYDLEQDITKIMVYMDLFEEDDENRKNTLIITHHPPLFVAKTPTYTIHSNWDIIDGGANDALAGVLNLSVADYLDKTTKIGRICSADLKFGELKKIISDNFENARIVNEPDFGERIRNVGVISGFGLKNPEYIHLSKDLDVLISGDLTHETAVLAKNLKITLIDLGHHESEIPGLYALGEILKETNVDIEIIDKKPIERLK